MKSNRHIVASLLLFLFSCMQLVDLHVVDHDATDEDCKLCQLAQENLDDDDDFVPVIFIESPTVVMLPFDRVQTNYMDTYLTTEAYYSFLNKAPPVV